MSEQNRESARDRIAGVLQTSLNPSSIEVHDESHKHAHHIHAPRRPGAAAMGGETHFHVKVVSEAFRGRSQIDRHRMINKLLEAEFARGLHALAIDAKAPGE